MSVGRATARVWSNRPVRFDETAGMSCACATAAVASRDCTCRVICAIDQSVDSVSAVMGAWACGVHSEGVLCHPSQSSIKCHAAGRCSAMGGLGFGKSNPVQGMPKACSYGFSWAVGIILQINHPKYALHRTIEPTYVISHRWYGRSGAVEGTEGGPYVLVVSMSGEVR